jgi:hypothetical protein
MTSLMRALRPAVFPAAVAIAASAVALTAGCQSSSSSSSAAAAGPASTTSASIAPASSGSSSATVSADAVTPVSPDSSSPAVTGGAVVNPGGPMKPAGPAVYLAEGGDVRGTAVHEPSCAAAGCPLSGDGTTQLSAMTWSTWTGTEAVGSGTEEIDGCTPNCATGKLYAVKVTVTFTKPVHVCAAGVSHWYWSQASFTWPNGLPAALKGANAPTNPFTYSEIASQSTSCG